MPGRKELMDLLPRKRCAEVGGALTVNVSNSWEAADVKINGPDNVYCRYCVPVNSICGCTIVAIKLITYVI